MVNFRLTTRTCKLQIAMFVENVCLCHYNSNWFSKSLQTQLLSCYKTLLNLNNQ